VTNVVLCGSFRRDLVGLQQAYAELADLGCAILSPRSVEPESECDGFVTMRGESGATPTMLVSRHLRAITAAEFVWLHAPDGYVGLGTALELGFATACGVPVYSRQLPRDGSLHGIVCVVHGPARVPSRESRRNRLSKEGVP